jgi:transposase
MGQAVKIVSAYSAVALRKHVRRERDGKVAACLLAIASALEGFSRTAAASQAGMDRQTLCDWIHRFNADGPAGLRNAAQGHPVRRR